MFMVLVQREASRKRPYFRPSAGQTSPSFGIEEARRTEGNHRKINLRNSTILSEGS